MLSETDGMVGGETYIKKGDGEAQKVITAPSYQAEISNLQPYRSRVHRLDMQ